MQIANERKACLLTSGHIAEHMSIGKTCYSEMASHLVWQLHQISLQVMDNPSRISQIWETFFFSRLVSMLWSKLPNWPKFECEVKKTVKIKNAVEINIMVLGKTQQKWNCSVKFLFQTCGQFWPFGAVFTAWKAYTKNRWVGSWDCPLALWQISSNT